MADTTLVTAPDGRTIAFAEWGVPDGRPSSCCTVRRAAGTAAYRRCLPTPSGAGDHLDRPGYGRSTRRRGRRVVDAADDVALIADRLWIEKFAVMGISAGGPCALAVAARLPERVTRCATDLGLGDYTAADLDFFAGMSDEEVRDWKNAELGEASLVEHSVGWLDRPEPLPDAPPELSAMLCMHFMRERPPGRAGTSTTISRWWLRGASRSTRSRHRPGSWLHARTRPCLGSTPNGRPRISQTRSLSGWKAVILQTTKNRRNARSAGLPVASTGTR